MATGSLPLVCMTLFEELSCGNQVLFRKAKSLRSTSMDRDEIIKLLDRGPLRVTMNDGSQFIIPSGDRTLVSSISVHVLYQDESDGKWRFHILSLLGMVRAEEIESAA